MNQEERRIYLIKTLFSENKSNYNFDIPDSESDQKRLLRSLLNVRPPMPVSDDFLIIQNEYLSEIAKEKGIVLVDDLTPIYKDIYLWQGDITRLGCDAIVNAANSGMTGCYAPCHACIDNCIHTFAGVQLRLECAEIMHKQGHEEKTGTAKITGGYCLPCRHVIHTVGPIITGKTSAKDKELLASCYRSCLEIAKKSNLESIAFCCISTGVFHFPNDEAAKIAIETVNEFKKKTSSNIKVIFNVYKELDFQIYSKLLRRIK